MSDGVSLSAKSDTMHLLFLFYTMHGILPFEGGEVRDSGELSAARLST